MSRVEKKIRKLFIVLGFLFLGNKLFAQGYPVIDVANLLESIETVYQTYQQIQNTIAQVQNQYEQIKQAATQMQNINFDDLQNLGDNFNGLSENPFEVITGVRNSAQQITSSVNKNMNKINKFKDSLTKESISFGGMKVSMADLCGAGDPNKSVQSFTLNAFDHVQGVCEEIGDTYTEGLTPEEKIAIMRKYGMSPRNYATIKASESQLEKLVVESNIVGTETAAKEYLEAAEAEQAIINDIVTNHLPEGATHSLLQMQTRALTSLKTDFANLINGINRQTALQSQSIIAESSKKAMDENIKKEKEKKQRREMNFIPKDRVNY